MNKDILTFPVSATCGPIVSRTSFHSQLAEIVEIKIINYDFLIFLMLLHIQASQIHQLQFLNEQSFLSNLVSATSTPGIIFPELLNFRS